MRLRIALLTGLVTYCLATIANGQGVYTPFSNNQPLPVGFTFYTTDPWHVQISDNPQTVPDLTPLMQAYFHNTSATTTTWYTADDNYLACSGGNGTCAGLGNFPIWQAATSDPMV